ncbi:MAG: hypothetical protein WCO04_19190, partial [Pseudomonadota bacterium]
WPEFDIFYKKSGAKILIDMAQTSQVRHVIAIECGQKATEGGGNRSGHAVCPLWAKRRQRKRITNEQEERSGLSCLSRQVM